MKNFYEFMYSRAQAPEQLPWHREVIPPALAAAAQQATKGKALDLGCGTGVYATYLAEQGFAVTALDFVPKALNLARERAQQKGVAVSFIEADILEWQASDAFDLVFDSGCFHGLSDRQKLVAYKQKLLNWLAPSGKFVLSHFCRRYFLDWRPMGPRRRTKEEIDNFFAPELVERMYGDELVPAPLPVGPIIKMGHYLFERA